MLYFFSTSGYKLYWSLLHFLCLISSFPWDHVSPDDLAPLLFNQLFHKNLLFYKTCWRQYTIYLLEEYTIFLQNFIRQNKIFNQSKAFMQKRLLTQATGNTWQGECVCAVHQVSLGYILKTIDEQMGPFSNIDSLTSSSG